MMAKLLTHDRSSGCLATAYSIEKLLLKKFCNNGILFRDSRRGIHRRIKRQERNENTQESTENWKNGLKKRKNVRNFVANLEQRESDAHDQAMLQFYRADYKPDCLKVMQASLERYLKSKDCPKSIIRDREFLNS